MFLGNNIFTFYPLSGKDKAVIYPHFLNVQQLIRNMFYPEVLEFNLLILLPIRRNRALDMSDILKDNYEIGMQTIRVWHRTATKETQWIIKHALRSEIKKGNPEAQHLVL